MRLCEETEEYIWIEFMMFARKLNNISLDLLAIDEEYLTGWFLVSGAISKLVSGHTERVTDGFTEGIPEDEIQYGEHETQTDEPTVYASLLSLNTKYFEISNALLVKDEESYSRGDRLMMKGLSEVVNTYNERAREGRISYDN